jgi:branched-subunit amino acid transport protein AzlD
VQTIKKPVSLFFTPLARYLTPHLFSPVFARCARGDHQVERKYGIVGILTAAVSYQLYLTGKDEVIHISMTDNFPNRINMSLVSFWIILSRTIFS